jgi:hypothetical protein
LYPSLDLSFSPNLKRLKTKNIKLIRKTMKINTIEITSEQIENFLENDQMSEIIELIKDLANGDYSIEALKQDILETE